MGANYPPRVIRPSRYIPTEPRSGNVNNDVLFRMSNTKIKGSGALAYAEAYAGSLSMSESIATLDLTGTLGITNNSTAVTGVGTAFTTELNPGQFVHVVNSVLHTAYLLVVRRINSSTSFTCWRAPTETTSGLTGKRLPRMFSMGVDRGTQIWGNTIENDRGTLFSVGAGTFRRNGTALNATLAVTRDPKVSLFNSGAGTYTHFTLGMTTSAAPALAAVAGGTKGMQAGNYSIVICPARMQTLGYNNPSLKATVTLAANDRVQITYPAMDTTNGQNAWNVFVTRYADSLGADLNYLEGPWYFYTQSTGNTAGYVENIEWLDAEVERQDLVTFDNDAPPDANFVQIINNVPVWISCQGPNGSSPGPFIFPAKPGNIEAAPAEIAFSSSPPETILGAVSAEGRIYLLTPNYLEIAQGTPSSTVPVLIRPFWSVGFTGPDQLVFVNNMLYGHSVQGPARSGSDGDPDSQQLDFADDVSEITDAWVSGHVLVAYDPVNNAVCYIHAANDLNSSGFWATRVLLYGLRQQAWIGDVLLSSTTQDMIVCGATMVNNKMYFLAGGRLANDTTSIGTYQFDTAAGSSVAWYVASNFSDYGDEIRNHVVKSVRVTGKITSGSFGVFGAGASESIPVTALEAGNSSSLTGAVSLSTTTTVTQYEQVSINVPNVGQSSVRVQGIYNGTDSVIDRVDELVIQAAQQGIRR